MTKRNFTAVLIPNVGNSIGTRAYRTSMDALAAGRSEMRRTFRNAPEVTKIELVVLEGRNAISGGQLCTRTSPNLF